MHWKVDEYGMRFGFSTTVEVPHPLVKFDYRNLIM